MVQKVKEQDGYILLHFDSLSATPGEIEFVVIAAYQQGQILYSRRRDDGSWTLPSGRVEHGETAEEAARRELLEEAGAALKQYQILCYMHCFMFGIEYWGVTYIGEIDRQDTPLDSSEIVEISMFADVPAQTSRRFEGQARVLHGAAISYISKMGSV